MAVTINTEPNAVQPLEGVVFGATLSSAGTAPNVISLGYKFFGPSGALIAISEIPYTGQEEKFDFTRLVSEQLSTAAPSLSSRSVFTETDFAKDFYLSVGEITFNEDTCETTVNISTNSSTIKAVNIRVPSWIDAADFDSGDLFSLTARPSRTEVRSNQSDWLHVFTKSGTCNYYVDAVFSDGTTQNNSGSFSITENAHRIPIGPANCVFGPYSKKLTSYTVRIRETPLGADIASYKFIVKDECLSLPVREFVAVEPLGGVSSLKIDSVSAGVSPSGGTFQESSAPGTAKSAITGGISRLRGEGTQVFTLTGRMDYSPGVENWLAGMFSSRQTWVRYIDRNGSRLVKCVVLDGQYPTASGGREVSYSVTVRMHHNIGK